jgi:hypothetical protein
MDVYHAPSSIVLSHQSFQAGDLYLYRVRCDANLSPVRIDVSLQVSQVFVQGFDFSFSLVTDVGVSHAVLQLCLDASLTDSMEASPCNRGRHRG